MIYEKIKADIKTSMKAYDAETVKTLRSLDAEIQNKAIATKNPVFTDDMVVGVIQKGIKQREESIEIFTKGGRTDLATEEKMQIEVWKRYLPTMLNEEEVTEVIKNIVANMKENINMGSIMKAVQPVLRGKADGKLISDIVKKFIGGSAA
jgi:uncharacterized protein